MESFVIPFKKSLRGLFICLTEILFTYLLISKFINNFGFEDSEKITKYALIIFLFGWLFLSYIRGRYSILIKINPHKEILKEFKEIVLITSLLTIFSVFLKIMGLNKYFNQNNLPLILIIIISCSIIYKFLWVVIFDYDFRKKINRILILGHEKDIKKIQNTILEFNYQKNFTLILKNDQVKLNYLPDLVLISNDYKLNNLDNYELEVFHKNNIKILTINKWFEQELSWIPVEFLDITDFLNSRNFSNSREFELRIKRIGDILFSLLLILSSLPLIIIASIFIWINDKGPLLYKQNREGIFRKQIKIIKLRTMITNAEKNGVQWAGQNDSRITTVGRILRKWRIDELPQLLSVLKGDMSLIGPRPERKEFNNILKKEIPNYDLRTFVKPGLSGWAQVNYPYTASINDSKKKLGYDLFYICNYSIFLDLLILFKTIKLILNGIGSTPNKSLIYRN